MTLAPLGPGASLLRTADAVRWEHGRIVEVGPASLLESKVPRGVPRFDLPGALVTPGFVDGHTHFAMWGLARRRVHLAGVTSLRNALARVSTAVPVQGWVLGHGWEASRWEAQPDRWALDRTQPLPVCLDSLDVHGVWVNSAALAAAGIGRQTPDPLGGRILRDGNGEPTGLLLERAVELIRPHIPAPAPDQMLAVLREAQGEAHRLGVTGIHNVEGTEVLDAFRRMELEGDLALRVLFHPPVAALPQLLAAGIRSGNGSGWLRIGGIKIFLDGSLGSRTAWMLEPYEGSRDRGLPITSESDARNAVRTAAAAGLGCTVHAIGDAAVRFALDLLADLPRTAVRHRIEHLQCVHPDDLARAARSGIVASMQPVHLLADVPLADARWGARSRGAYACRSLLDRGTELVFGSDAPVASLDPREGVFAALERTPTAGSPSWYPTEKIGFREAVFAYTAAAADAAGERGRRGTLAPGEDADLVAWNVDPAVERDVGDAFRSGHTALTVVGGRVVFQA